MPTSGRRAFVPQAIRLFQAQDYPDKELIVFDNGPDSIADLIPDDPQIRYCRDEIRRPLGTWRNLACEMARGDILLHWDDDDWYAPWRIRYQVAALTETGSEVCGIDHVYFLDEERRQAWQYVYPGDQSLWVCGATLCFSRERWRRRPFRPLHIGEDTRFVRDTERERIAVLPNSDFFIGRIHHGNTSPKRTCPPLWRAQPFDTVQALKSMAAPEARPPSIAVASAPNPDALVSVGGGIGDILRMTPLIRVLHHLGHAVDLLLVPDYPAVAELLRGASEMRRLIVAAGNRAPQDLAGEAYGVCVCNTFGAPLLRKIKADRHYGFDHDRWTRHGDTACVEDIARSLGWSGPLPAPFALPSGRRFDLPAGTIALHPGCKPNWPWKKWHGFDQLAGLLPHVAIIGSDADLDNRKTYFGRAFQWPGGVSDFVGRLDLADTAALIGQCAALVSNDSGLMHLGVALGVPTFGIFGITDPGREGMASPHFTPISKGLDCEAACREQPWGRRDCGRHLECLKTLTADEVAAAVAARLVLPAPQAVPATEESMDTIRLNYYGYMFDASGYGQAARTYVHALHGAGVKVSVIDLGASPPQTVDPLVRSLLGTDPDADFQLFHGIPPQWSRRAFPFKSRDVIAMTVWETDTMPQSWRPALSHAGDVWLPCRFNVDVFGRGLGISPFLLPHARLVPDGDGGRDGHGLSGVSPSDWVCYSIFEWQDRKDPTGMLEAFLRAFPTEDDAVLVLKSGPASGPEAARMLGEARKKTGSGGRVILCCEAWSEGRMAALHERGDCYLSLHKGEGWGYPLFEAACRGKPVVAPHYSGPADYLDAEAHPPVRHQPAVVAQPYVYYSRRMKWAQSDVAHAAELIRWVHDNREQAGARAARAALRLNEVYGLRMIGETAKARLVALMARKDSRRGRALEAALVCAPPPPAVPIEGAWYNADYFEHGRTSNWSQGYSWALFRGVFEEAAAYLAEIFPQARTVLDMGCAKGFLVRALRQRQIDAWGFDHSPWALSQADPLALSYVWRDDIGTVAFERRFDLLVAMSLFESLTEAQLRAFLRRARAAAATLLAVIATLPDDPAKARSAFQDDKDLSHITMRTRAWWQALFEECGWVAHHRQREGAAHSLPRKMGWEIYVYDPQPSEADQ